MGAQRIGGMHTLCVPVIGAYTPTDSADNFITLLRKPVVGCVLEHDAVSPFIWDMQSVRYQAGAGEADDRQSSIVPSLV